MTVGKALVLALVACTALGTEGDPPPRCDWYCLHVYDPVCGSDGVTYGNECELSLADCRNPKKDITVVHEGPCGGGPGGPLALQEKADEKEDVTQQEDVAPANATNTDNVNLLCCPGQCCIAGFQDEMDFSRCMIRCRNNGGHHHGCRRGCCSEVAGCSNCGFC